MTHRFIGEVQAIRPGVYGIPGQPLGFGQRDFGGFRSWDCGKRVYRVDGVLQMENDEQRKRRLERGH